MKVSLNWLREFVELPPTVGKLVELLTLAGVEVEGVETSGCAIENVVVAQIKSSEPHPNADRLSVCQVNHGAEMPRKIVCGAKNYKVGDKVPLALPGAILPGGFTIKVGKLRGVESQGMMCSGKELNLSADSDGLLILSPDSKIGTPLGELYPGDTVLDLEITPNRPDLLSVTGIAREIGALTGNVSRQPNPAPSNAEGIPAEVSIATELCPFYSVRRIAGVKVGPSPDWMRRRLEAAGLRPINNIVDITNYVMLELGQPLHAFDAARLDGDIRVRLALESEQFRALDGRTYNLAAEHVVIADASRAIAIGGVMGGEDSGVTEFTREILLESADFSPASIRRTSRQLGLSSDSSYRFERGVDPAGMPAASHRAAQLIVELAGGSMGPLAVGVPSGSPRATLPGIDPGGRPHSVTIRPARLNALLGVEVPVNRIEGILSGFGLVLTDEGAWSVPSFRRDLTREIDLIEEIARVVGMDQIPGKTQARFAPANATDRAYDRAMNLRRTFVAQGLHEARSLTLVAADPRGLAFTQTPPESLQRVKNPMIDDQIVLRPNLLDGLLTAVETNLRAGTASVRLFEIGRVFSTLRPEEFSHAAIVLTGPTHDASWRAGEGRETDLFDMKGLVSAVLGDGCTFNASENPALALSLTIEMNGKPVGCAGQLWPADARDLDATAPVLFAEFDLGALEKASSTVAAASGKYREIPRFPTTSRDIAMIAPLALSHETINSTLAAAQEPLLADVRLFDVFTDSTGQKVPADKKSLAYSLTYRASDRTLTADEVNAAHGRLKQRLTSGLGVSLRE